MNKKVLLISGMFILSMLCGVFAGIAYIKTETPQISKVKSQTKDIPEIYEITPQDDTNITEDIEFSEKNEPVFESEQYVVTLSDTKILIYKIASDGSMQTIEEKNVDTGSIPMEDYQKLYSGILVPTLEEAKGIVEDYIS